MAKSRVSITWSFWRWMLGWETSRTFIAPFTHQVAINLIPPFTLWIRFK